MRDSAGGVAGESVARRGPTSPGLVVSLDSPEAADPALAGAKAANLARCAEAGLPTLPGFVVTTGATARGVDDPEVEQAMRVAWEAISSGGAVPLVVRSSSTIEDAAVSSMAGRFTSVLDVVGWEAFLGGVRTVLGSALAVRDESGRSRPMAVLVQPQLESRLGGVLFGVDPVSGDRRRIVIEAVTGGPDSLVSGRADAAHLVVTRRGRVVESSGSGAVALSRSSRRALARLARRSARAFGGAQDVEWAEDVRGRLWLLQSRPVTAVAEHGGKGHRFGPGPVAETFPAPLHPLERDLWIVPLREGITRALLVTGAASRRRVASSPVLTTVRGWAACDLDLLGIGRRASAARFLNPVPAVRRLVAAWTVGRLRVALPGLSERIVGAVDADLAAVPDLDELSDSQIVELLERARSELAVVHTLEVLAGMLLHGTGPGPSAAAAAIDALRAGRAAGRADTDIVAENPVVLALTAPAICSGEGLPETRAPARAGGGHARSGSDPVDALDAREALRLRTRWLQELTARAAERIGSRLAARGALPEGSAVRHLDLDELADVVAGRGTPTDVEARCTVAFGAPLPPAFRLTLAGDAVPARHTHPAAAAGVPAGGGRVTGRAMHRVPAGGVRPGGILVVAHLEPSLAAVLPQLDGLVSETGGALSHLAILARETGVPTVVAVPGARTRFPPGATMLVDGSTGEVELLDGPEVQP